MKLRRNVIKTDEKEDNSLLNEVRKDSKSDEVKSKINEIKSNILGHKNEITNKVIDNKYETKDDIINAIKSLVNETNDVNNKIFENKVSDFEPTDNSDKSKLIYDNKKQKSSAKKETEEINIHKDHRSRLKKQFRENGGKALTEVQILELLLFYAIPQKDTNPIAHKLINKFGSLRNVLMADVTSLMSVSGIKENSATLISLVNSLFRYISMPTTGEGINSVMKAIEYCNQLFQGVDVEQFYVICLSKNNIVKSVKMIQSGTSDEISVQIRNITEFSLESKCNRIIVTHNHPYGNAEMSDEDCSFTYSLLCSCLLNSIDIVDHVIIGVDSAYSLAHKNILKQLKNKAIKNINVPMSMLNIISSNEVEYKLEI